MGNIFQGMKKDACFLKAFSAMTSYCITPCPPSKRREPSHFIVSAEREERKITELLTCADKLHHVGNSLVFSDATHLQHNTFSNPCHQKNLCAPECVDPPVPAS
eukprot:scaffold31_cov334-Pavlova_lutheri.AAC.8